MKIQKHIFVGITIFELYRFKKGKVLTNFEKKTGKLITYNLLLYIQKVPLNFVEALPTSGLTGAKTIVDNSVY